MASFHTWMALISLDLFESSRSTVLALATPDNLLLLLLVGKVIVMMSAGIQDALVLVMISDEEFAVAMTTLSDTN